MIILEFSNLTFQISFKFTGLATKAIPGRESQAIIRREHNPLYAFITGLSLCGNTGKINTDTSLGSNKQ